MKIYHKGRYVKNVPAKYSKIPDLPDYFEEIDSPRLSCAEYRILDLALFHHRITPFLEQMKRENQLDHWLIEKSSPVMAHEVTTDDNQVYYSLLFRNGFAIRINRRIYKMCPKRRKANWNSPDVALPPYEQLKMTFA